MGLPSYIATDARTMLGMPFHLVMVEGYLVRFYIGTMPGYQCVFSFVTELQVWNVDFYWSEFMFANKAIF